MSETKCPELEYCLALKGAPIGMYHCGNCGEMILAGIDTTGICPLIKKKDSEATVNARRVTP